MIAFQKKDLTEARQLIKEKKVGEVLFSEGTYQIEVTDSKEKATYWPFLQVDEHGKISDAFCTCKMAEKKHTCRHLAVGHEIIFREEVPLHIRFRESLWNQLCQMASRRHGYDMQLQKKDKEYRLTSPTGKPLFSMTAGNEKGKKRLAEILLKRTKETEETSLKFSNLSTEELALWKEGRPSHQLRYELSFWSDLAKWWMLMQEAGDDYKITFVTEKEPLPKWIQVKFSQVSFNFYIAEVNWPQLIQSLATVEAPLTIFELQQKRIKSIEYNPITREFHIESVSVQPHKTEVSKESIRVGDWLFVPGQGFYPADIDPLLMERVIPSSKIATALGKHLPIFQKYLLRTPINSGGVRAQYDLFFDDLASLHIQCYVFEKGDLQKPYSAYFGPWVYLEDKGFYLLENLFFDGAEKIIPKDRLPDFINRHRVWLSGYEGFHTHITTLESQPIYRVDEKNRLIFESRFDLAEETREVIDLDEWVYIKGAGFYSKSGRTGQSWLKGKAILKPDEISSFIHGHRDELEHIQGFFSDRTPIDKSGLHIFLNDKNQIICRPEYTCINGIDPKSIQFFDGFTYIKGEGFSEVPASLRLPVGFGVEKMISTTDEPYFIASEIEVLKPFILKIDPRLNKPSHLFLRIKRAKKDEKSKVGMWIFELEFETEYGHAPIHDIWRALCDKQRYLFSDAGLLFLKQPQFAWLKNINKKRWLQNGKQVRLNTLEWLRLSLFNLIKEPEGPSKEAIDARRLLEEFRTFQTHHAIDLSGFKSDLRQYQEMGLKWLWFLYSHGLSGLLCDEMGLGKTHQAMALLAAAHNADSQAKYLVVCPTSVIYHWEDLLKRFFPQIRVCFYYGIGRTMGEYDLLLTSYGVLRSERKNLAQIPFDIAIFDEIQIAKNLQSQTNRSLRLLQAKMKIGLTGTPIENRLIELKALFDIVLPGYLPVDTLFREIFVNPIERMQDEEKKVLLSKLIRPFILRRKKAEVLLELPEKIEEISYCDLSEEQHHLYHKTVKAHRDALLAQIQDFAQPVPYAHVFSLLSTLKQICDHPCLITKQYEDFQKHKSGKWDLFIELLQEIRDSNQKVVIFSQYLDMLDMIESHLKEHKIGFAGIRGSTRNRKQELDRFREDPACEVFVASLQAAGVGIDLVSASVVIHYDRWWNPAKENQATDRVHRIGQNRGVQVFKLVTKNTIEEHIHRMIERKLALMEVVGYDDQEQIKTFERQELIDLLRHLEEN